MQPEVPRHFEAEASQDGVLGGNLAVGAVIELIEGQVHAKDSDSLAFRVATIFAVPGGVGETIFFPRQTTPLPWIVSHRPQDCW